MEYFAFCELRSQHWARRFPRRAWWGRDVSRIAGLDPCKSARVCQQRTSVGPTSHDDNVCKKIAVRENYIHISHKERCLSIDIVAWTILFVYNRTKYSVFHFLQCIRKRWNSFEVSTCRYFFPDFKEAENECFPLGCSVLDAVYQFKKCSGSRSGIFLPWYGSVSICDYDLNTDQGPVEI